MYFRSSIPALHSMYSAPTRSTPYARHSASDVDLLRPITLTRGVPPCISHLIPLRGSYIASPPRSIHEARLIRDASCIGPEPQVTTGQTRRSNVHHCSFRSKQQNKKRKHTSEPKATAKSQAPSAEYAVRLRMRRGRSAGRSSTPDTDRGAEYEVPGWLQMALDAHCLSQPGDRSRRYRGLLPLRCVCVCVCLCAREMCVVLGVDLRVSCQLLYFGCLK
ncbi:hypothetical protein BDV18DRAFT_3915 [Aspergillus unguis]